MKPQQLYVELNRRCNLGCDHCDFWKSHVRTSLSLEEREALLDEFAEMGGQYVVTCGGESMLDQEDFFHLHRTARSLGLKTRSVTNGTRVHVGTIEQMMAEGPTETTVSLDSPDPLQHDHWRGQTGSWQSAVRALSLLLEWRRHRRVEMKVYAMAIVSERNYRELPALFEFVLRHLGADKLKLNIMQPSFGRSRRDLFFDDSHVQDPDALMATIAECDDKYQIRRNPKWLSDVRMYCESVRDDSERRRGWSSQGRTREVICNSCDRNIMVDSDGMGRLCFHPTFPGRSVKQRGELTKLWRDADWRDEMRQCKRYCGISHSVRASHATMEAV